MELEQKLTGRVRRSLSLNNRREREIILFLEGLAESGREVFHLINGIYSFLPKPILHLLSAVFGFTESNKRLSEFFCGEGAEVCFLGHAEVFAAKEVKIKAESTLMG